MRNLLHRLKFSAALYALLGLCAWLSTQYTYQWRSVEARYHLSPTSIKAVQALDGTLSVDAWIPPNALLQNRVTALFNKYQRHKIDMSLNFIDPATRPSEARALSVHSGGEIILALGQRQQRLTQIDEQSFTHALLRLARVSSPTLRFTFGHGERSIDSSAAHNYTGFVGHLRQLGMRIESLSLITTPVVPQNTNVLVVAAPSDGFFPGEVVSILNYIARGGNLLWLLEPGQAPIPQALAAELGLSVLPGVIVDAATQQLAVDRPDFAVIDSYPTHPALGDSLPMTLFPQAAGLSLENVVGWEVEPLLITHQNSWLETGQLASHIRFDAGGDDVAGPILLGASLSRTDGALKQRIAVVGDADFLANTWLENGGNLYLGQQLVDWLSGAPPTTSIAPWRAHDAQLTLSQTALVAVGTLFFAILPAIFLLLAFLSWRKQRL